MFLMLFAMALIFGLVWAAVHYGSRQNPAPVASPPPVTRPSAPHVTPPDQPHAPSAPLPLPPEVGSQLAHPSTPLPPNPDGPPAADGAVAAWSNLFWLAIDPAGTLTGPDDAHASPAEPDVPRPEPPPDHPAPEPAPSDRPVTPD